MATTIPFIVSCLTNRIKIPCDVIDDSPQRALNSVNKRSYERLKGVRDIETRKQKARIDAIIQNWVYLYISWEATLAFLPTLVTRQTPRAHDGPPPMDACQPPA